jgi:hypothetical protein
MRRTCITIAALALTISTAIPAAADFRVKYPDAETGEFEIEPIGDIARDPLAAHSGEASYVEELEYGINDFWRPALELAQQRAPGPGQPFDFSLVIWENVFQFTERGHYWADAGFFAELGKSTLRGTANETTFGPIFRKEMFHTINTVNLFISRDFGNFASPRPAFIYAWETRIALGTPVEPGFQAYGQPSSFAGFNSGWPQDNRIGPQLFGTIYNLGPGKLKWNAGVLFGIRPWAPRETLRWQVEYEIHF